MQRHKRRLGIVGFGKLGQYLYKEFHTNQSLSEHFEICFIWNRTPIKNQESYNFNILENLEDFARFRPDLIIEVAHPNISKTWAKKFLQSSDYFIGSPTAFCDPLFEKDILGFLPSCKNKVYIGKGALSGLSELQEYAKLGMIQKLQITMEKAPESINYQGPLPFSLQSMADIKKDSVSLFRGSVRQLGNFAPNNVNTMVIASLASGLGLDKTQGELIASPRLQYHNVSWCLEGPKLGNSQTFKLEMKKHNPSELGAVTGSLTYASFMQSVKKAQGQQQGVLNFC